MRYTSRSCSATEGAGSLAKLVRRHREGTWGFTADEVPDRAASIAEMFAQEACAVWCLMIRHAVLTGTMPAYDDIARWVPHPERWRQVLAEAGEREPGEFIQNGWSVGAMQAAWSAITHTPASGPAHLVDALRAAILIGHDTDTVAAISGALLGARCSVRAGG